MPKGSAELMNVRREEIVTACAVLYESMSFKDITIKEIGNFTSFTRTSIYNYFQTKEEIFLALLQREYERWIEDLTWMENRYKQLSAEDFASSLAASLDKRPTLLKLLSMNLYDIEANSRLERLVEFKRVYADAIKAVTKCLEKFFPYMGKQEHKDFLYTFFPFIYGIYPYAFATAKQREAMSQAGIHHPFLSIYEIAYKGILKLLGMEPRILP